MKVIFYTGTEWKGFEAPKKPNNYTYHSEVDDIKYNKAYAEAKRNALTVLNKEVIQQAIVYKNGLNDTPIADYDYDWPGELEVKNNYTPSLGFGTLQESYGIVLSLPNTIKPEDKSDEEYPDIPHPHNRSETKVLGVFKREIKTKTVEESLRDNHTSVDMMSIMYAPDGIYLSEKERIEKAMQEYSDQQLAAFKEKFKEQVDQRTLQWGSPLTMSAEYVKKLIDQL
jgi:hypothetical protein